MEFDRNALNNFLLESGLIHPDSTSIIDLPVDAAIQLFGFIPNSEDLRWAIIQKWNEIRTYTSQFHLKNAIISTYLSKTTSKHSGSIHQINRQNILQTCRALTNCGYYDLVLKRIGEVVNLSKYQIQFARTDNISTLPNNEGITGCPEAIYQLRLWGEGFIARIGFNIHIENCSPILSITNIQGGKGKEAMLIRFENEMGLKPFNYLIHIIQETFTDMQIRGLRNPRKVEASALYNTVLKQCKIPRFQNQNADA